jgi:hypothetical protein
MEETYKYKRARKVDARTTRLAYVEVSNGNGEVIGKATFTGNPKDAHDAQVTAMVDHLIRDYRYTQCIYEYDGQEDGIDWYKCVTHDCLNMGNANLCNIAMGE